MSNDSELARAFADHLNVDGLYNCTRVTLVGTFESIDLPGVARLAASDYRFVVEKDLALVAILPKGISPELGAIYEAVGVLQGVGFEGVCPGFVIDLLKYIQPN